MLIAQLFLVVSVAVATADVIADSPVQNSPAEFQAVNCGSKLCKNGAKCINETTCECRYGTKGDECEVVIDCAKLKEKCDRINTECIYEPNLRSATCKCEKENTQFNGESCVDCNCGEFGTSCYFSDSGKFCICKKGYFHKLGKCAPCSCGELEDICIFDDKLEKFCTCKKGGVFKDGTCIPCSCGPKTKSCGFETGEKYCLCEEGYQFKLGTCEKCDCGANSTSCYFAEAAKRCSCTAGSEDKLGTCTHCDCGPDTICKFTNIGEKDCVCIGEACADPGTPWFKNPIVIVCIVFIVVVVVGIPSFVAYRRLRSNR